MSHTKISFDDIPWDQVAPGLRVKQQIHGEKQLRLIEFTSDYDDQNWCSAGHSGYVIAGRLTLAYDDGPVDYAEGDALQIEDGLADRHRTVIKQGERAVLFLVEDATG